MGRKIHIGEVRSFAATTPVFTSGDVERLVGDRGYALLLLHNMVKRGELHRISRGYYSLHDDPTLTVFTMRPAYLGLQDALSTRGLWEQETNAVVVTTSKAKPGTRRVMGSNVVVHRINPRFFFGYDYLLDKAGGFYVPVSDLEKTLIDLVYFGESPGREILSGLAARADRKLLAEYLSRYDGAFQTTFRRSLR